MTKAERQKLERVIRRESRRVDSDLLDSMAKEDVVPTDIILHAIAKLAEKGDNANDTQN